MFLFISSSYLFIFSSLVVSNGLVPYLIPLTTPRPNPVSTYPSLISFRPVPKPAIPPRTPPIRALKGESFFLVFSFSCRAQQQALLDCAVKLDSSTTQANVEVYKTNAAGIGEHPGIVEAIESEVAKIAEANDKIETIRKYF